MKEKILESVREPDFSFMVITRRARTQLKLKPHLKGVRRNVIRVPASFIVLFFDRDEGNTEVAAFDPDSFDAALLFLDHFSEASFVAE